jgi:hypothetical protein
MGEIAEMHLDGTLCERCGEYLGRPVGYPRYCRDCWKDMDNEEKQMYNAIYGKKDKKNAKFIRVKRTDVSNR